MEINRQQWLEALRNYLGVPFLHQGRTKAGLDCVGLLGCAADDLGIPNEVQASLKDYARAPDSTMFELKIKTMLEAIPYSRLQAFNVQFKPGDIFSFWVDKPGKPRHVAVYMGKDGNGNETMLHSIATKPHCVVEQPINHSFWVPRIHGAWKLPNLKD